MSNVVTRFWNDQSGQGLTEYALVIALVSVGLIAVLTIFRDSIGRVFDRISAALDSAPSTSYTPGS